MCWVLLVDADYLIPYSFHPPFLPKSSQAFLCEVNSTLLCSQQKVTDVLHSHLVPVIVAGTLWNTV